MRTFDNLIQQLWTDVSSTHEDGRGQKARETLELINSMDELDLFNCFVRDPSDETWEQEERAREIEEVNTKTELLTCALSWIEHLHTSSDE